MIYGGNCHTRKFITDCKANLAYSYLGESYRKPIEFSFVDFSFSDYAAEVVIQKSAPENATLTLAIDQFWNRVATATLLIFGSLLTAALFGARSFKLFRTERLRATAAAVALDWVQVVSKKSKRKYTEFGYRPVESKFSLLPLTATFKIGEEPYFHFDHASNTTYALAVRHAAGLPILLDRNLDRLKGPVAQIEAAKRHIDDILVEWRDDSAGGSSTILRA